MKARLKSHAGFTLMEMVIAGALMSALSVAALSLMSSASRSTASINGSMEAQKEIDAVLDRFNLEYGRRKGTANALTWYNGEIANQVTGCTGVGIRQQTSRTDPNSDVLLVDFVSVCVSGSPFWGVAADLMEMVNWSCPANQIPKIHISRTYVASGGPGANIALNDTYYPPLDRAIASALLCFSTGNGVNAYAGSAIRHDRQVIYAQKKITMPFIDHNPLIEVLPQ